MENKKEKKERTNRYNCMRLGLSFDSMLSTGEGKNLLDLKNYKLLHEGISAMKGICFIMAVLVDGKLAYFIIIVVWVMLLVLLLLRLLLLSCFVVGNKILKLSMIYHFPLESLVIHIDALCLE